ncbi:MAG: PTS sugar transporter subunit IIB [Thermotaleaceae bacterium]
MNILLCCSTGMSTSLLVQKMEKEAEFLGLEGRIWSVPMEEVHNHIDEADVLLLGPQVRFKLTTFQTMGEERGIPVDVINMTDYGMINGKKVLEHAMHLKE